MAFIGADGTLALGRTTTFAGKIDGLAPGDTIDFLGQAVIAATAKGSMLNLHFMDGTTFGIALGAPLTGDTLQLATDGHGGTTLTVHAAALPNLFGPDRTSETAAFTPHVTVL